MIGELNSHYRQISQREISPSLNVICEINIDDVYPTLFVHIV